MLLAAETLILNRTSLAVEAKQVGYWRLVSSTHVNADSDEAEATTNASRSHGDNARSDGKNPTAPWRHSPASDNDMVARGYPAGALVTTTHKRGDADKPKTELVRHWQAAGCGRTTCAPGDVAAAVAHFLFAKVIEGGI